VNVQGDRRGKGPGDGDVAVDTDSSVILAGAAMDAPVRMRWLDGELVYFSAPSPRKRKPNQDALGALALSATEGILAVADGVGGLPCGGEAAAAVVSCLVNTGSAAHKRTGETDIVRSLKNANQALLDEGDHRATTIAVVHICGRHVTPHHVGDSSVMVTGQRGRVKLMTVAHSPTGIALALGLLNERGAMFHPQRHLVNEIVGQDDMHVETGKAVSMTTRDTLVIATDGLWDNLFVDEIKTVVRTGSLRNAANELVDAVHRRMGQKRSNEPGKPDDLTFFLYRPAPDRNA
jgi:serine/threonine protein phosphatase PrpC